MDDYRKEFIKELLETLKIPTGAFNIAVVSEEIVHITNQDLREFYKAVLSADTYGNGMKAVIKTAELFKVEKIDRVELKAKEFIRLAHTMNIVVFDNSRASGRTFEDELKGTRFTNVSQRVIEILDNVAPHYNHKNLIANIRTYSTAVSELTAFKNALKTLREKNVAIESPKMRAIIARTA